ncbi:MAG: aspartate/glutamate racemase family protein [Chitinophagaceae bacterium]|nr:aspartate/glutamate racemase family protein [Chitinophagaceae bacterium]
MRKCGLIGGISWVSTIEYYRYINEGINERLGGLNFAECLIYSLNFNDIQAKTWANAFPLLVDAANSLKAAGAEAIALCANTAHMYADELEKEVRLPVIHIGKETAKAITQVKLKNVGLLGTIFTMEQQFYISKLEEFGLNVLVPDTQEDRDYIQLTLKEELGRGIIKPETKKRYLEIIDSLIARGVEGVILGCTEIPLLIEQSDCSIPVFDTTKIHSAAIVDFMLS